MAYDLCRRWSLNPRSLILLLLLSQMVACSSIPPTIEKSGAMVLSECPNDLGAVDRNYGFLLTSIEFHINSFQPEYAFALHSVSDDANSATENSRYLFRVSNMFGLPSAHVFETGRFDAEPFCFLIPTGNYRIERFYNYSGGWMREYKHKRNFTVAGKKVTYLGRYVLIDPRLKGKGYFRRMGVLLKGMFTGTVAAPDAEIDVTDAESEDSAWLLGKFTHVGDVPIINTVELQR